MSESRMYTSSDGRSAASKFGQMIGEVFEHVIIDWIRGYISEAYSDYELLESSTNNALVTLNMLGGSSRQMDTVLTLKDSDDPVALLESKWLKDARHHNDKGAWILQLREVRKKYPTIRGAAAILAGYWTEGVGVMLRDEGGIKMVLVATDEEIYSTLQDPLDRFLGDDTFDLNARDMRIRYPRPWDLANCLIDLQDREQLKTIALSWLEFPRKQDLQGQLLTGRDLMRAAIDQLLGPLPPNPSIQKFEIALQIDTGNTIYNEFDDVEAALDFLKTYFRNPENILKQISPRRRHDREDFDVENT